MADEKIIFDVEITTKDAAQNVDLLTESIKELEKQQEELYKKQLKSEDGLSGYNKEIEISKEKIKALKSERTAGIKLLSAETKSRESLKKSVSILTKERDKLNLSTKEGQQRLKEINKEIDKNNKALKNTGSELDKQRMNIGNYGSAFDGLGGSFGGAIEGIKKLTMASKLFISSGLGFIILAIVVALKALTSYFRTSEEGQNALNKVTKVFGVILGNLSDLLSSVGKKIFEAFNNPRETLIKLGEAFKKNILNRFYGLLELIPQLGKAIGHLFKGEFKEAGKTAADAFIKVGLGVENFTDKVVDGYEKAKEGIKAFVEETKTEMKVASQLADLEAYNDQLRRKNIEENAKLQKEIAENRYKAVQDDKYTSKERIAFLEKALQLEKQILENNLEESRIKAKLKEEQNKLSNSKTEDLEEEAKLRADLTNQQTAYYTGIRRMENELQTEKAKVRAEEKKEEEEAIKEAELRVKKKYDAKLAYEDELIRTIENRVDEEIRLEEWKEDRKQQIIQASMDSIAAITGASFNLIGTLINQQMQEQLDAVGDNEVMRAQIEERYAKKRKKIALAEAIINGALAVLNALNTKPFLPLGPIMAATAATLAGIQIATINATQFAKGGVIEGPSHAQGGIPVHVGGNYVGEMEGRESLYIINKYDTPEAVAALSQINSRHGVSFGTPVRYAASGGEMDTSAINIAAAVQSALKNMVVVTKVTDINNVQSTYANTVNNAVV